MEWAVNLKGTLMLTTHHAHVHSMNKFEIKEYLTSIYNVKPQTVHTKIVLGMSVSHSPFLISHLPVPRLLASTLSVLTVLMHTFHCAF